MREHWLLLREWIELTPARIRRRWREIGSVERLRYVAARLLAVALPVPLILTMLGVAPACELVYRVSPALAQFLRPERRVCICEGIELRVESVERAGDDVDVVFALRDLTGDRLDGDSDPCLDWGVLSGCRGRVDFLQDPGEFDEASQTLRLPVRFTNLNGGRVSGKLTFFLDRIRASARRLEEPLPVDLANIEPMTPVATTREELDSLDPTHPERSAWRLEPGYLCTPIEGVELSALGYIDGLLHVQFRFTDPLRAPRTGDIFLESEALGDVYNFAIFGFDGSDGCYYGESIFEISPEDAANYELRANLLRYEEIIEGEWRVTFRSEG